jgi:magnesium-transporting ATPase (P-type)
MNEALEEYGHIGLRTLCLAQRGVGRGEYDEWVKKWKGASMMIENREEAMEDVMELIEVELELVAATAIEDKLQDEVPETIHRLREAGCKVWLLTGDKGKSFLG